MASKMFSLPLVVTPSAVNVTLSQVIIATNERVLLHAIDVQARGATGASSAMHFDWGTQDGAGVSVSANIDIIKGRPTYAADVLTTALKTFTTEAVHTTHNKIVLHEQTQKLWVPPNGPIVMEELERWGLKFIAGNLVELVVQLYMEE